MGTNGSAIVRSEPQDVRATPVDDRRLALEPSNMDAAWRLAEIAAQSGLTALRSPAAAMVILQTGRELGLTAMQSLRGIYVVQGKPVIGGDTLVAVVLNSGKCESWTIIENDATKCTIETLRKGARTPVRRTWTIEDAKRVGLTGKDNWKHFPQDMLRHRCASALARTVYPDVCLGLYTPEEIESAVVDQPEPSRPVAQPVADPDALAPLLARLAEAGTKEAVDAIVKDGVKALPAKTPERAAFQDAVQARRRAIESAAKQPAADPPSGEHPAAWTVKAWAQHIEAHEHQKAVCNSFAKHVPEFGEDPHPYWDATMGRLIDLGLEADKAAEMLTAACEARKTKGAE